MTVLEAPLNYGPVEIDEDSWYYEDKTGIDLIHEERDLEGNFIKTVHIKIPWRKLVTTMERFNKARRGQE